MRLIWKYVLRPNLLHKVWLFPRMADFCNSSPQCVPDSFTLNFLSFSSSLCSSLSPDYCNFITLTIFYKLKKKLAAAYNRRYFNPLRDKNVRGRDMLNVPGVSCTWRHTAKSYEITTLIKHQCASNLHYYLRIGCVCAGYIILERILNKICISASTVQLTKFWYKPIGLRRVSQIVIVVEVEFLALLRWYEA